ncbi:alpha/beta hydrolase family protein [Cohnella sp. SGD-V74]|nr:alpha/beta hydrolase family protein [Cohnella sp. SGD-V74]
MSKYAIHEDFKKLEKNTLPFYPIVLPLLNKLMQRSNSRLKLPDGIVVTKKQIKGYRNGLIDLFLYEPANLQENAPCLVYFHGGAFALKEAHYHIRLVCDYALRTPCKVVFVDYRLLRSMFSPSARKTAMPRSNGRLLTRTRSASIPARSP